MVSIEVTPKWAGEGLRDQWPCLRGGRMINNSDRFVDLVDLGPAEERLIDQIKRGEMTVGETCGPTSR